MQSVAEKVAKKVVQMVAKWADTGGGGGVGVGGYGGWGVGDGIGLVMAEWVVT